MKIKTLVAVLFLSAGVTSTVVAQEDVIVMPIVVSRTRQ